MYHIFFIHSSVDGHLGFFHVLVLVNSAAVKLGYMYLFNCGFLRIYAREWECQIIQEFFFQFCFFLNKFIYLFIYFWLHWVFVAVHGLSLVAASGDHSLLQCAGFSLRWLLLWQSMGSRHVGFSSCGSRAVERRLSSWGTRAYLLCGMWDLPRPGLKPVSPASAGRFLTTAPARKPFFQFFKEAPQCSPQWLYQFTFPPTRQEDSLFSIPSPAFIVCRHFDDHSDWCEVIPNCSFDLHFSNNK